MYPLTYAMHPSPRRRTQLLLAPPSLLHSLLLPNASIIRPRRTHTSMLSSPSAHTHADAHALLPMFFSACVASSPTLAGACPPPQRRTATCSGMHRPVMPHGHALVAGGDHHHSQHIHSMHLPCPSTHEPLRLNRASAERAEPPICSSLASPSRAELAASERANMAV